MGIIYELAKLTENANGKALKLSASELIRQYTGKTKYQSCELKSASKKENSLIK